MRTRLLPFILLLSLGWVPRAWGTIRPRFDLEGSTWEATHIVVATEGEKIDGGLRVIESWKGDLGKGDVITVPELKAFAAEDRRAIAWDEVAIRRKMAGGKWRVGRLGPTHVTGARMVLFLRKAGARRPGGRGPAGATGMPSKRAWEPTSTYGLMKTSVTWIEHGEAYGFDIGLGPSVLLPLWMSKYDMRDRADRILAVRSALGKAIALPDTSKRAEALRFFTQSYVLHARWSAFRALGECGEDALPVLRPMLRDDALLEFYSGVEDSVVHALVKAGGVKAVPDLTGLLERDLAFWKRVGPGLKKGWGTGPAAEATRLRNRSRRDRHALRALGEIGVRAARGIVVEYRDFWRSQRELEYDDIYKDGYIGPVCDQVLRELEESAPVLRE